jgi:hypothetical protein
MNCDPYRINRIYRDSAWERKWGDDPLYVAAMEAGEREGDEGFERVLREAECTHTSR